MKRCYVAQAEEKIGSKVFPQILEQLKEDGEPIVPSLVIFCSDNANFGWYARMLSNSFPDATVIGMTSNVLYSPKGVIRNGLSVLAVTGGISVSTGVLFEVSRYPSRSCDSITQALAAIEHENTVCLEFNASVDSCEEIIMDTFHDIMQDSPIQLCGCTAAAAENPDRPSAVSLNGIVYMDACVFAMIHNETGRIGIIKENMFKMTEHFFVATDVDCDARKVYEFDHKTATSAVANALAVPEDELAAHTFFHPMGRLEKDDLGIIAVREQFADGSMKFFSRIYNQTRVVLLDPIDPVEDVWKQTDQRVRELIPEPSFCFVINCYLRTKYFVEHDKMGDYNRTLASFYDDYIGVSGFGEQHSYRHLNQTMLILVFE
ncbi:MAG: hypothetical protein J5367_02255 [Lachnospiraceae bacterium]|nr:hypothetical protein [Lachnospiraceae bacterium]